MNLTIFDIIYSWFSNPLFTPFINFVTVVILAITAYEGFRSMRATSEANELSILPLLVVKFIGKPMQDREVSIKNIGNGSAYDIRIEKYTNIIIDTQDVWELYLKLKGVNVLERGEEKELSSIGLQNGKESGIKDFLIFHLDPEEEHQRKPVRLLITFKNAKGVEYYSMIETGHDGLTFVIPPSKLDFSGYFIINCSNLITWAQLKYFRFIWKFKKPHFAQPK